MATDTTRRWIIHADLDAFFASVEVLLNPALRGRPVIVGGDPDKRGVVASASYEARAYGVRSAMPMAQALRLCPQGIVIHPRHRLYAQKSRQVIALLREFTPIVEQISIDEAFLDVTGCQALWGPIEELATTIKKRVRQELGLAISLGAASSKLVAKIACSTGKPDGLVIVRHGEEAAFLAPLPVEALWGVGPALGGQLRQAGIATIGDLARRDLAELERLYGETGRYLYDAARGRDRRAVGRGRPRRSISQERTFARDTTDREFLWHTLLAMSEELAHRLRLAQRVARTVSIKLRTSSFKTHTRQITLDHPTNQADAIAKAARQLLDRHWKGQPLRLIGLEVSGVISGGYQLALFDGTDQRRLRLSRALDEIRARYGPDAVTRASLLKPPTEPDTS